MVGQWLILLLEQRSSLSEEDKKSSIVYNVQNLIKITSYAKQRKMWPIVKIMQSIEIKPKPDSNV